MKSLVAADFSQKLYVNGKLMKDVDVSLKGDERGLDISSNINGKNIKKYVTSSQIKHILGSKASTESLESRLNKLLSNKSKSIKNRKQKNKTRKMKSKNNKTRKSKK